jgi:hypothetical protein
MVKTRVLPATLCLAALALASTSLFAQDNKVAPLVTIVEGSPIIHKAEAPPPGVIKLYSNLGTGSDVYYSSEGWTISGLESIIGAQQAIGLAYTPSADSTVEGVQVGVGYVTGANTVAVAIFSDENDAPGKPLKVWNPINLPTFGTCCTLVTVKDAAGIKVAAGTQYWLVVGTDTESETTWDAWNFSYNQVSGTISVYTSGSGVWTTQTTTLPAAAIYGTIP